MFRSNTFSAPYGNSFGLQEAQLSRPWMKALGAGGAMPNEIVLGTEFAESPEFVVLALKHPGHP